jgi:hypothetical protein
MKSKLKMHSNNDPEILAEKSMYQRHPIPFLLKQLDIQLAKKTPRYFSRMCSVRLCQLYKNGAEVWTGKLLCFHK